jgi:hypothetical protein
MFHSSGRLASPAVVTCNYSALGHKFNTGEFPCIYSTNLFTSNADGTNLKKVLAKADYDMGELFWIQ